MSDDKNRDSAKGTSNIPLSTEHQQANRYALTVLDMDDVTQYLACCVQLGQIPDTDTRAKWYVARHGLLSAAIVAYCRPFQRSYSEGFATRSISADKIEAIQQFRERSALHALLVQKRNSFVAHADWTARSVKIISSGQEEMSMVPSAPDLWAGVDLSEFEQLAGAVRAECVVKALDQAQYVPSIGPKSDV